MRLGIWDIFFNLALFTVWARLWKKHERTVYFNPYIGAVDRAGKTAVDLIRSMARTLSDKAASAAIFLFAILFRAVLFRSLAGSDPTRLELGFGIVPPVIPSAARLGFVFSGGFWTFLALSLVSFGVFLFYIWGLSLIYAHSRLGSSMGHTEETLYEFSKPLTFFKREYRPFALLLFGMGLTVALIAAGPFRGASLGSPAVATIRLIISAMLAWVHGLQIMLKLVMGLIIGSWIAMFSGSFGLAGFCRDWLDLFLGPMRRFPIRIGMLDLSPIVFFLVVHFVANMLDNILRWSYASLP